MDFGKLGKLGQLAQGQDQFIKYVTERVNDEHCDSAKELLCQDIKKIKDKNYTKEDMKKTQESLMKMVKPGDAEAVKTALSTFASQIKK